MIEIQKNVKGEEALKNHPEFGKAVFIECGWHSPENFCYDHHVLQADARFMLSAAGMVHTELLMRRKMPSKVIMNHSRHFDNLVAGYLLEHRLLALSPKTSELVMVADTMDRVGPLAALSVDQLLNSVLLTSQNIIPFKEWEQSDEVATENLKKAIASLRGMVAAPIAKANYDMKFESEDKEFCVVMSKEFIGNTLYEQGYNAYAAYVQNKDESFKWTLCKASDYVPFNIIEAVKELNQLEGLEKGWGGRSTIAGSPMPQGTKLSPETVIEVLKKHYQS